MKKYKLLLDPEALKDIEATAAWYNAQSSGIGARYKKQIKLQIGRLAVHPDNYTIRYKNVRCMLVRDFPFLVHFIVHPESLTVEIFAVIHTSRNPEIWEK